LGKPAGLAEDGLPDLPDVFDFMAKRVSLDTELVLVIVFNLLPGIIMLNIPNR
jgi:hypothetical protein